MDFFSLFYLRSLSVFFCLWEKERKEIETATYYSLSTVVLEEVQQAYRK